MSKHTPGPWTAQSGTGIVRDANGNKLVVPHSFDLDGDEEMANARLIAAAPDAVAILERAVQHIQNARDSGDYVAHPRWEMQARALLASIEGDES